MTRRRHRGQEQASTLRARSVSFPAIESSGDLTDVAMYYKLGQRSGHFHQSSGGSKSGFKVAPALIRPRACSMNEIVFIGSRLLSHV
jgi:hypothetical protein